MVSVNLMPPSVMLTRRRKTRTRRWAAIAATAATLAAVPLALDVTQSARASSIEARIAPMEMKRDRILEDLKLTVAKCSTLSTQIARADALRAKRDWDGLLTMIGERTPDSVWLTGLRTESSQPRQPAVARGANPAGQGAETPVVLAGPTGMQLEGYALTHEALYEFMSALKAAEVFNNVELASAGKEPVLEGSAVRFVIDCDW